MIQKESTIPGQTKRFSALDLVIEGFLIGFLLEYATDLIIPYAGASSANVL